jgi:RNase P subunit RPR2
MTLAPGTATEFASTQYIRLPDCPHCGTMLLPPESSEFLGRGRVRNTWSCEDCGEEFRLDVSVARGRVTSRPID